MAKKKKFDDWMPAEPVLGKKFHAEQIEARERHKKTQEYLKNARRYGNTKARLKKD
jgi:hypothetical protein